MKLFVTNWRTRYPNSRFKISKIDRDIKLDYIEVFTENFKDNIFSLEETRESTVNEKIRENEFFVLIQLSGSKSQKLFEIFMLKHRKE